MKREFRWVRAKNLQPSSILPKREHSPDLSHSVKKNGIQQLVIVRRIPGSEKMYEILDGLGRVGDLDPETKVLVDVRSNLKDTDFFKISDSTFTRTDRTTHDRASFYKGWVDAVAKETGSPRGSQKRVAEEAV